MKEYRYLIYQITDIANTLYAFRSWDEAKELIKLSDYDCRYSAEITFDKDVDIMLEKLFRIFNMDRPDDFKGHSLSMSDIVALIDDKGTRWYYCDWIGWKDITDYMKETKRNIL